MAGFTRHIRGFGQSTSNTTNSTNTSSDNYSYYIRNEAQESYQHKNASWDPGRSFSNQYNDTMKKSTINDNNPFSKNTDAMDAPGVGMYKDGGFNMQAGNAENMHTNRHNPYNGSVEDFLVKREASNYALSDSFVNKYSFGLVKIILIVVAIMASVILAISSEGGSKTNHKNKFYYNESDF